MLYEIISLPEDKTFYWLQCIMSNSYLLVPLEVLTKGDKKNHAFVQCLFKADCCYGRLLMTSTVGKLAKMTMITRL